MQKHLKKYCSVFFLFLLLFPMVEKQVHAFEHRDDIHCSATDKHFHELEHHCNICDYTSTDSNPVTEHRITFFIAEIRFSYFSTTENVHTPEAFRDIPARAPPVA